MNITELKAEMEKDAKIDITDLAKESVTSITLYNKYQSIFYDLSMQGIEAKKELDKLRHDLTQYYLGKADDEVYKDRPKLVKVLKSEVDDYIKADEQYVTCEKRYLKIELLVKLVEDFLKQLSGRTYAIKNAIDYIKFQNGQ